MVRWKKGLIRDMDIGKERKRYDGDDDRIYAYDTHVYFAVVCCIGRYV